MIKPFPMPVVQAICDTVAASNPATIHVDCEQFLFFSKLSEASAHARVSRVLLDGLRKQRGCSLSTIAGKKKVNDRSDHTETTLQRSQ